MGLHHHDHRDGLEGARFVVGPPQRKGRPMTIPTICLIIALACFILSSIGVASRVNLTALGLAFITAAMLLGDRVLGL